MSTKCLYTANKSVHNFCPRPSNPAFTPNHVLYIENIGNWEFYAVFFIAHNVVCAFFVFHAMYFVRAYRCELM